MVFYVVLFRYSVLSLISVAAEIISTHDKLSLSFFMSNKDVLMLQKESASHFVIGWNKTFGVMTL